MNLLRKKQALRVAALFFLVISGLPVSAQTIPAASIGRGSTAFCLFEASAPQSEKRVFLNLGIVQYVELRADEVRVYYGGGNLGSGHEFRLPVTGVADAQAYLQRMQSAAASCAAR